jgi:hypothetical protein
VAHSAWSREKRVLRVRGDRRDEDSGVLSNYKQGVST